MPAEQDLKDMLVALTDGKSCMDCGAHPVSELCGPTCHSKHEKGCPKHEIQYVVGFLFNPARRTVLLLQKTHPEWQFGMWNGPGGKLEPDVSGRVVVDAFVNAHVKLEAAIL